MGLGILLGLAASVSWACTNVYVQRATRVVGPFRALLWSQVLGALVLAGIAAAGADPRTTPVDTAVLVWLAAAGLASLVAYLGMFDTFERAALSVAVPIMSSWSFLAALFAVAVFGERLRPIQIVGGFLVIVGVVVVSRFATRSEAPGQDAPSKGRGWLPSVFAAAVGFGVLIPMVARLAPALGRFGAIACVYAVEIAVGLPLAAAFHVDLRPPTRQQARQAWPLIAAAGLFETAGFVCISLAGARAPIAIVSPLASLASAFTVLFAWVWLRERPARPVLLGAALACVGVLTLAL